MERPIGVIDSGVGGMTVAYEIMRQLPKESILYLGDTKRCPYGSRNKEEVLRFTREMVDFLLYKQVKMIVVACNTATAFALEELKCELPIPVLGVIRPGARAAIKMTRNHSIGVIGTEGTILSNAYPLALNQINNELNVSSLACPLFVPLVEKGILSGKQAEQVVAETLLPFVNNHQFDTLILGCTHYPMLKKTIQKVIGDSIKIISSSEETARETGLMLEVNQLLNKSAESAVKHHFYTTGELLIFKHLTQSIYSDSLSNLSTVHIDKVTI